MDCNENIDKTLGNRRYGHVRFKITLTSRDSGHFSFDKKGAIT